MQTSSVKVVDLFSGIGGLTHGFVLEGLDVVAGIDIDESCRCGFERNNGARFIQKDVNDVTPGELVELFGSNALRVLIGCAPCQPFSTLNLNRGMYKKSDEKWASLDSFLELIMQVRPEIVSMENVAELSNSKKFPIFGRFVATLKAAGYHVSHRVIDASKYGVPQRRKRLVLLGSLFGPIDLIPETHVHDPVTVEECIEDLAPIRAGQASKSDPVHRASMLSRLNKRRIAATPKDGGGPKDWRAVLLPRCFRKKKGKSYKATVYGRMKWGEPGPTMTTQCTTLGTGRFGHPAQNRAISLREAARLQTFPDYYQFHEPGKINASALARHIGNAVPVRLGQIIAISIKSHLYRFNQGETNS